MRFLYCPNCGKKTVVKQLGDDVVDYCMCCNSALHTFFYTCVIIVLINKENKVCVIKQSYGENKYVLVAGFVNLHESLEECVVREIKEETGLITKDIKYIGSFPMENKDNLMVSYVAHVDGLISLSSEVKEIHFVDIDRALLLLKDAKIAYKVVKKYKEEFYDR